MIMGCICDYKCPVRTTLELIGGKYKTLVLWHLIEKPLRFGELCKLIPQATYKMLTQQLRDLERDGLILRKIYPVVPLKVEYSLSEQGRSIRPLLEAMYKWGNSYLKQTGQQANCSMGAFFEKNTLEG
jgi:DNA-binding HxlR family transcriptional regulator